GPACAGRVWPQAAPSRRPRGPGDQCTKPGLHARGPEQDLGHGHHLHSHLRGLAVPGGSDGPVFAPDRGWATAPTMTSDLVLQALVAAAWRRKPGPGVMVHSDQGCQFTSSDWQSFLKAQRMVPS